jgi:hypothetical protein
MRVKCHCLDGKRQEEELRALIDNVLMSKESQLPSYAV